MTTGEVARIRTAIERAFADDFTARRMWSGGVYNRRKIAGSQTWSQHAWGNAWDVMVADLATGDRLRAWLRQNRLWLPVGTVLWRVPAHYDHLHIEGKPKRRGVPPVIGEDDENMEKLTTIIQQALVDAGYPLPRFGVDGDPGDETQKALTAAFRDARSRSGLPAITDLVERTIGEIRTRLD